MHGIRSKPAARHSFYARRSTTLGALLAICAGLLFLGAPTSQAAPPTPPSAATARSYLSVLTVRAEGSSDGYSRDRFPHWSNQGNRCNTREVVLKRDGTNVQQDSECRAISGSWYSPYDGATWSAASDVDIDHVVPLAEAWRSGASGWTNTKREAFANDLTIAQLIAVTDTVNQAKGDKDPAKWMPPRSAYHCTYARMWVWVKYSYGLSVDSAEKSKLTSVLNSC
ncbi:MAG TPA: HNH endonuclease family protein [Streptomyces sp.]|nr:HNH endonuclease family protein [Streptomyces sp.]